MSLDEWLTKNMSSVLVVVEILWVAGFLAVFVVYFLVKRRVRADKRKAAEASPRHSDEPEQ